MNDRDRRRRIRRQVRRQISPPAQKPPNNTQAKILAGLNIISTLADAAPKYLGDVLHYGPESFVAQGWAAALIWYRAKGYNAHQHLTLFGVWAVDEDEQTPLLVATKNLEFSAALYNAESYHRLIQKGFKTYYGDDGSPPPADNIIVQRTFDPTRRLALRRELAEDISTWLRTRTR